MSKSSPELQPLAGQRKKRESDTAVIACSDWLRLGSGRTIPKLLAHYQELSNSGKGFVPPTTSIKTLETWSSRFSWPLRADEYEAASEARKNAERQRVMKNGLALDYQRVRKLKRLVEFLESQIYELAPDEKGKETYHNVWVPDVKGIGSKDTFERVPIRRFNAGLIQQYRDAMDDLARETGGRVQKQDLTSDGQPITVTFNPIPAREKPPV